jgi:hypothetical protein
LSELDAHVEELSNEFERVTAQIVADHFETASLGTSTALFLLGLIPTIGNVIGAGALLAEVTEKLQSRRENGWVGFLGKAKGQLNKKPTERQQHDRSA